MQREHVWWWLKMPEDILSHCIFLETPRGSMPFEPDTEERVNTAQSKTEKTVA